MAVRVYPPIAVAVPMPGEVLVALGLDAVQAVEKGRIDRFAPPFAALGRDLKRLGKQVLLGVDDVHQIAQGFGRVFPASDVDVDAAGRVWFRARFAERPDELLYRFDVFPPADGADELGHLVFRGVDATVANELPFSRNQPRWMVRCLPSVVGSAGVLGAGPEMGGDNPCRLFARDTSHFDFDTEGLLLHGVYPFRPGGSARPRPGTGPSGGGVFPAAPHSSLDRAGKARYETAYYPRRLGYADGLTRHIGSGPASALLGFRLARKSFPAAPLGRFSTLLW